MSEALEKLENTFTEETFTRKPLLNYTIKYFTDLSGIINDINDKNEINSAIAAIFLAKISISSLSELLCLIIRQAVRKAYEDKSFGAVLSLNLNFL